VQSQILGELVRLRFGNHFAVTVGVKLVDHHPIEAGQFAYFLARALTQLGHGARRVQCRDRATQIRIQPPAGLGALRIYLLEFDDRPPAVPVHKCIPVRTLGKRDTHRLVRLEISRWRISQQICTQEFDRVDSKHTLRIDTEGGRSVCRAVLDAAFSGIQRNQDAEGLNGAGNMDWLATTVRECRIDIEAHKALPSLTNHANRRAAVGNHCRVCFGCAQRA
jgi:hypothetical protein